MTTKVTNQIKDLGRQVWGACAKCYNFCNVRPFLSSFISWMSRPSSAITFLFSFITFLSETQAFAQACNVQIVSSPSGGNYEVAGNHQFQMEVKFVQMSVGNQYGYIAKKNGVPIPGQSLEASLSQSPQNGEVQITPRYVLNNLSVSDAGEYTFEFFARCGTNNSTERREISTAVLNIRPQIRINLVSQMGVLNAPSPNLSLVARGNANNSTTGLIYRWEKLNTSGQWALISGATQSTYSPPSPFDLTDIGRYRAVVGHSFRGGSENEQISEEQYLVIDFDQSRSQVCSRTPAITLQPVAQTRAEGPNTINNQVLFESRFTSGLGVCHHSASPCFSRDTNGSCTLHDTVFECRDFQAGGVRTSLLRSLSQQELRPRREWLRGPTAQNPNAQQLRNDHVWCEPNAQGNCHWDSVDFRVDQPRFQYSDGNIELADDQYYQVRYHDACSSTPISSNAVRLTVNAAPPTITNVPQSVQIFNATESPWVEGGDANGGDPKTFEWSRYNATTATGAVTRVDAINRAPEQSLTHTNENLYIPRIRIQDAGWYQYKVINAAGNAHANVQVKVRTLAPQYVLISPATSPIYPGNSVTIHAGVIPSEDNSFTKYRYEWLDENGNALNPPRFGQTLTFVAGSVNAVHRFRVRVSNQIYNAAGPDASEQNGLTSIVSEVQSFNVVQAPVVQQPPSITNQPTAQSISEGGNASFSVGVSGTAPFTYQWYKTGTPATLLSDGAHISGSRSNVLTIINARPQDAGSYYAVVSGVVAPNATSQTALLTVNAVAAPGAPSFTFPANNAQNVPENLTFTWSAPAGAQPGLQYEFFVAARGNSSTPTCESLEGSRIHSSPAGSTATTYSVPGGSILFGNTFYVGCVRARTQVPGPYARTIFRTRNSSDDSTIPKPLIRIEPAGSGPQGQVTIDIVGTRGEYRSTLRIYQIIGSRVVLAAAQEVTNADGSFRIPVNVESLQTGEGTRTYYAQNYRPQPSGAFVGGPISDTASYRFDPSLTVPAPVVVVHSSSPNIKIRWNEVSNATSYRVWRRVGLESCSAPFNCYQTVKPFRLRADSSLSNSGITEISTNDGKVFEYTDDLLPSPIPEEGVAYFVTAHNEQSTSRRSPSVSILDRKHPARSNESLAVLPVDRAGQQTGRDLVGFLCGIDVNGYFQGDVSADLITEVRYIERLEGETCSTVDYSEENVSQLSYPFDAIQAQPIPDLDYSAFNCLLAMEIKNLEPQKFYCVQACLKDPSGNRENVQCLSGPGATPSDELAPDFNGLSALIPMPSGEALKARWNLAREDQPNVAEVIQYEVKATSFFNADGKPDFNHPSALLRIVDGGTSEILFDGLRTATNYCVVVSALDEIPNRNTPPNSHLCARTLSNLPEIRDIRVEAGPRPWEITVSGIILHRLAQIPGNQISLDRFQFQEEGSETWVAVDPQYLSGDDLNNLPHSASMTNATRFRIVFDTLPFLRGEAQIRIALQVRDNHRNRSILAGTSADGSPVDPELVNDHQSDLSASASDFIMVGKSQFTGHASSNVMGCSLQEEDRASWSAVAALMLMMLGLLTLRYFSLSRKRT